MLDRELEKTLNSLFAEAREQRYEFMTIEHLLFALLNNNSATAVLNACGANLNSLHDDLIKFIQKNSTILMSVILNQQLDFKEFYNAQFLMCNRLANKK